MTQSAHGENSPKFSISAKDQLSSEDLRKIVNDALKKYPYPYLLRQTVLTHEFVLLSSEMDCTTFTEGQVFGPNGELHWKKQTWPEADGKQHGWRIAFVGLAEQCPDSLKGNQKSLDDYEIEEKQQVLLRGEKKAGQTAWFDLRIPKPLFYPVDTDQPVKLHLRLFKQHGRIEFVQMMGLF
ncbi:MAG: hypothetical protein AB9888_15390 [Bacteroidales bacterium]